VRVYGWWVFGGVFGAGFGVVLGSRPVHHDRSICAQRWIGRGPLVGAAVAPAAVVLRCGIQASAMAQLDSVL
jgi:hypothetical protein